MKKEPGLDLHDVLLSVTTLSFDIAALEIFLPLIVGAKLDVATREVATDAEKLKERLETAGITTMQATPATWRMLLEAGWKGSPHLKILCGGEALSAELGIRLRHCGAELWNLYGPTETTIWSTLYRVQEERGQIPIGRPIANTQLYVLDGLHQPVPLGASVELYIGGSGLARGYLNRPELTAEKFVAHPFSSDPEARLYRTGDVVRYLSNGDLEFFGRLDHQVKLRGYRIELGEIEFVLNRHPAVQEAIALVREDTPGDQRLVAYLVATQDASPAASELRSHLKEALPDYMIPSAFVLLPLLPRTLNGKVDRKNLPVPDPSQRAVECEFVAARSSTEKILAEVWSNMLHIEKISMNDNFFDLGGHSILAAQLVTQLRKAFGVEVPLHNVFRAPTIAEFASMVESLLWTNGPPQAVTNATDRVEIDL
jgi:acyl-coenzyme A synthetase/AMP-(fatty) acid ligase/acyl carrier protein